MKLNKTSSVLCGTNKPDQKNQLNQVKIAVQTIAE